MYEISLKKSSLIFQSDKLPFSYGIFAKLWSLMVKKITVVGENLYEFFVRLRLTSKQGHIHRSLIHQKSWARLLLDVTEAKHHNPN